MCFNSSARVLDEFAKFRVRPGEIGSGHVDKVIKAANDAAEAGVKRPYRG